MASPTHRPREHLLVFILIILACLVGVILRISASGRSAEHMVANEDAARSLIKRLATVQERQRASSGRYATLRELEAAGQLEERPIKVDSVGVPYLPAHSYRIDVLLPGTRGSDGHVELVRDAKEDVSAELRTKHFAIVARPVVPAVDGFRILYIDESGEVWVSEGASDEEGRNANPLPRIHLTAGGPRSPLGLAWLKWEDIIKRHAK